MREKKQNVKDYVRDSVEQEKRAIQQSMEKEKRMRQLLKENEALQGRLRRMRGSTKKQKQRIHCHEDFIEFLEKEKAKE